MCLRCKQIRWHGHYSNDINSKSSSSSNFNTDRIDWILINCRIIWKLFSLTKFNRMLRSRALANWKKKVKQNKTKRTDFTSNICSFSVIRQIYHGNISIYKLLKQYLDPKCRTTSQCQARIIKSNGASSLMWWSAPGSETWSCFLDQVSITMIFFNYIPVSI